jgi:dipeptide/tripeptide permease
MAFNQNGTTWQDVGDQMALPFGQDPQNSFFDSATTNNIWNPFFIVILAPTFANYVYPYIDKKFGPEKFGLMQRMILGQFLAGLTFLVAAGFQNAINENCFD